MSLWRQLRHGVRALRDPDAADRDAADEVRHFLDEAAAAHMERGLSREQALRAVRVELGSDLAAREEVRGQGWENKVETFLHDLRYAARRLRAAPTFTAATILTLALGIGGTTAIFSAVNRVLFEPLPYPDAARVAMLWEVGTDGARNDGSFGMYRALAERSRSFDAIAALKPWRATLSGSEQPERLEGQRVSAGYFDVLGVAPSFGRAFHAAEDAQGGPSVVVISDSLWRRRLGAAADAVGKTIALDGETYTVVGVMPDDFENALAPSAEVWAPLQYDIAEGRAWGHHLRTVGRLRPGVEPAAAARELGAVADAVIKEQRPATYGAGVGFDVVPLQQDLTRDLRLALLTTLGAMLLVLLMACVNVSNLILARGVQRRGEFALRASLGAGRGRLVRQLMTESLLLAALGGAAGMGVALLGVHLLDVLGPPGLPRAGATAVDGVAFALGLALTTVVGLVCGVGPALYAAGAAPGSGVSQGTPRVAGGHRRARSALVVVEVALALVLLVASGLLLRSLERLFAVDAGFDASRLLTLQVQASGPRFDDDAATRRYFAQVLDAVRRVPGVASAGLTSQLPLSGDYDLYGVHFDPARADDPGENRGTFRHAVSAGYLETMGIPLLRGRLLEERDGEAAPFVALVSESLAKRRLPGVDPVGQRLRIGPADGPLYTVVGVVGDVRQVTLANDESEAVYTTTGQWQFADSAMSLAIRSQGDPAELTAAIRQAIWSVDKDQAIVRVATMQQLLERLAGDRRFALTLFQAFALAALLLAAAGIYGVISGSVAERVRELAVHVAMGATRRDIVALVLRQGMTLAGIGIVIGLAGALFATPAMVAMLFGITRLDPVTWVGTVALLGAVSLLACGVPAWRAARVDPATTLRAQ